MIEKYAKIYNWLEDETSRDIFINRMFYNITADKSYIKNIVKNHTPYQATALPMRSYYTRLQQSEKIIIYGAGQMGEALINLLSVLNIPIFAVCGRNPGKEIQHHIVISPEEAASVKDALFILATTKYVHEVSENLHRLGIPQTQVLIMDAGWLIQNDPEQYFDKRLVHLTDGEVFIDCGAADGYDTDRFFRNAGENCKSYVIEPFAESAQLLKNKYYYDQRVMIVDGAVWDADCRLGIDNSRGMYSSQMYESDNGSITGVKLDTILVGKKVTYIKMDIEGAELSALKGAKKTIQRQKPRLAICVYHKPEDLLDIPLFIKSLVPEYKLFFRHYANYACETVLYAL